MTCARYADADVAERYVLGQMDEPEQASFEEHFFGCDDCLASVQVLQQMQTALQGPQPVAVSSSETSGHAAKFDAPRTAGVSRSSARGMRTISPAWWGLAVAATLLLGLVLWQRRAPVPGLDAPPTVARQTDPPPSPAPDTPRPTGQPGQTTTPPPPRVQPPPARPARDIGLLALVVPPPYVPLQTRGAAADTQAQAFAAAMTRYSAKDYQGAADDLRIVAEAQPDAAHVHFFLGISLLMTERPADARRALDRTVAIGAAPFADEAHFYLAKAALKERDLRRAERELQLAIEHEAGPAGEAARLLREARRTGE